MQTSQCNNFSLEHYYFFFLIHTCRFASEDIDSSTIVIWITVIMAVCAFLSVNFWAPIASYVLFKMDYFLKILIYIHMKKESHIQQGRHEGE